MKYRKKPVIIEAIQWDGNNAKEIMNFCTCDYSTISSESGFLKDAELIIHTLEGDMKASVGDYIIKGVQGEFYPCKPNIFEETYELVED